MFADGVKSIAGHIARILKYLLMSGNIRKNTIPTPALAMAAIIQTAFIFPPSLGWISNHAIQSEPRRLAKEHTGKMLFSRLAHRREPTEMKVPWSAAKPPQAEGYACRSKSIFIKASNISRSSASATRRRHEVSRPLPPRPSCSRSYFAGTRSNLADPAV